MHGQKVVEKESVKNSLRLPEEEEDNDNGDIAVSRAVPIRRSILEILRETQDGSNDTECNKELSAEP